MRFEDLDAKMRAFEQSLDQVVAPANFIVARLDGRGFTRLTKELCDFEAPFDERFNKMMVETVKDIMSESGIGIIYGYTQSDEISLLLDPNTMAFGGKIRKLNSILAGEASARFSLRLGRPAAFDSRIIPLPNGDLVQDYFRWRMEDSTRNCLNAWCYWTLRKEGKTATEAASEIKGKSIAFKNEFLFQRGINFNDLPVWQRRGVGVRWRKYEKAGHNPLTGEETIAIRREVFADYDIPKGYVPSIQPSNNHR